MFSHGRILVLTIAVLVFLFPRTVSGQHEMEGGTAVGGRYLPPGDYVPPNPGVGDAVGGGGGPAGHGRTVPGATGSPDAPSSPGPAHPSSGLAGPRRGGPAAAPAMARRRTRASSGFERWEIWWEFNKDRFLDLKNRYGGGNVTLSGTGGFLVGRGRKDLAAPSHAVTAAAITDRVLPALRATLKAEDATVAGLALPAVARVLPADRGALIMEDMLRQLGHRHAAVREMACLSLGILGSPEGREACEALMLDSEEGRRLLGNRNADRIERAFSAVSLGLIGDPRSAAALRDTIESADPGTQRDLAACAILALGLINDPASRRDNVDFLLGRLADEKMGEFVRAFAPIALARLDARDAAAPMLSLLTDEGAPEWLTQSCAIGLGRLAAVGDGETVDALAAIAGEGKDIPTRHFALMALAQIGARDGAFGANRGAHLKITRTLTSIVEHSANAQDRAWAGLAAAVHARPHAELAAAAAGALAGAFINASNPSEKSAHALGLGLLGARNHGEMLLMELQQSSDQALQGYLCVALGLMRWQDAVPAMRSYLADLTLHGLRIQAATGLGLMGDRDLAGLLVDAVKNSSSLYVTSSAAAALALLGDAAAVDPLIAIIEDKDSTAFAKCAAIVALGLLAEKTDLPWNAALAEDFNYCLKSDAIAKLFST